MFCHKVLSEFSGVQVRAAMARRVERAVAAVDLLIEEKITVIVAWIDLRSSKVMTVLTAAIRWHLYELLCDRI